MSAPAPLPAPPPLRSRLRRWRPVLATDTLLALASVGFALGFNAPFWRALLAGRELDQPLTWWFVAAVAVALAALHFVVVAPLANRFTVRPLLTLLILVAAFASYFMQRYGVYLDPDMLRNVLHTDVKEASELLGWALLPHLFGYAVLPIALLWRVRPLQRHWGASLWRRPLAWLLAAALGAGALLSVFQDVAATMRNHRQLRYLITPANALWSLAVVLGKDTRAATQPRAVIGADAARTALAAVPGRKPLLLVLVLGETVRAANWGLNGYARQTTPQLAARPDVISFGRVGSCGTNTEVSLPCLFSPWGRRGYDEARIRGSQGLLQVLQRAGVQVFWRDNQSGCKGVCDGLPSQLLPADAVPALCDGERCLDEVLLHGLDDIVRVQGGADGRADQLLVLHPLGNHGPAYYRRYPAAFRRFTPTCDTPDLRRCSREQIVNAYDNALLYTDHVLARALAYLEARSATHDTALIYVSDHGESLGEGGLYLHGLPFAIAPDVQTQVPMLVWLSRGFAQSQRIDLACLRRRAAQPASHDHLFHSMLGLLDVTTRLYEPAFDLVAGCRR